MAVKRKNPAAVNLGRKGGKKGGPARAARLTPPQRSESARKAVPARWAKDEKGSGHTGFKGKDMSVQKLSPSRQDEISKAAPATDLLDTSKKALHLCLKRIRDARDESELRRLTEDLQRIVFHKQYRNAKD